MSGFYNFFRKLMDEKSHPNISINNELAVDKSKFQELREELIPTYHETKI